MLARSDACVAKIRSLRSPLTTFAHQIATLTDGTATKQGGQGLLGRHFVDLFYSFFPIFLNFYNIYNLRRFQTMQQHSIL